MADQTSWQYVWFPGDAATDRVSTPNVVDMDGESQFDWRYELFLEGAGSTLRFVGENSGVMYMASVTKKITFRMWDVVDGAKDFTSSVDVPYDNFGWFQIRAVVDATVDPTTCTFYTRDAGSDIAGNTGWAQLGTVQTDANTATQHLYNPALLMIGGKTATAHHGGMSQVLQMYGAGNTIQIDVDFRNTAQLSSPFASMVADDGLTYTLTSSGVGGLEVVAALPALDLTLLGVG